MTYRQKLAWKRRAKHAKQIGRGLCMLAAAVCFFLVLGSVGAIEREMVTVAEGMRNVVLAFAGMFMFSGIAGCK